VIGPPWLPDALSFLGVALAAAPTLRAARIAAHLSAWREVQARLGSADAATREQGVAAEERLRRSVPLWPRTIHAALLAGYGAIAAASLLRLLPWLTG
jgi:hypothetical protein